jgi:hypothetical protein
MPSQALLDWQRDRMPRLDEVDAQCATTFVAVPPSRLADENLRGYVMLLSAHFQGFCRELHSECIQIATTFVPPAMQYLFQAQCVAGRELNRANPQFETIRKDFERFGFNLNAALAASPANATRITHIGHLNSWRNYAAHHKKSMPTAGGPFTLATVQGWRNSCDGLATELDGIMYNQLQMALGKAPW